MHAFTRALLITNQSYENRKFLPKHLVNGSFLERFDSIKIQPRFPESAVVCEMVTLKLDSSNGECLLSGQNVKELRKVISNDAI
mmetsp:Transcript_49676/g.97153  ORF Transcript_49676/g.97153 Transcript_49676/m.97153 type:complete len:84 (-) Transcript_49676:98-349(-)